MAEVEWDCETQKTVIAELLKTPLRKGDTWYLIDTKWFNQWKKYVGYNPWDTCNVGDVSAHPGPLDNASLYKDDSKTEIKEHLIDELDYMLVPEEAWNSFCEWYDLVHDQVPIARKVIEHGMFVKHSKVEVYLMELKLCCNGNMLNVITKHFSRADTIGQLENAMRCLFNIDTEIHVRMWIKYMTNTFEQVHTPDKTIQDIGLYPGQHIVIEKQRRNGSWWSSQSGITQQALVGMAHDDKSPDEGEEDVCKTGASSEKRMASPGTPTIQPSLECSICLTVYSALHRVPKVLTCGHTFCATCVSKLRKGHETRCPTCREKCTLPVHATNYSLLQILEACCQSCHGNLQGGKCDHCGLSVCETCREKHIKDLQTEVQKSLEAAKNSLERLRKILDQEKSRESISMKASADLQHVEDAFLELKALMDKKKEEIQDWIKTVTIETEEMYDEWATKRHKYLNKNLDVIQSFHQQAATLSDGKQLQNIRKESDAINTGVLALVSEKPKWDKDVTTTVKGFISSLNKAMNKPLF